MNKYLVGAMAGFTATAPMTAVMFLLHNQLPKSEKYPLPPEDITKELAARAGAPQHLNRAKHQAVTWMVHFGFGATAGLLYSPIAEKVKAPPALKGVLFGLLVWATSYLGWLPKAGILNQPKDQPLRPNWLMIVAHLVWGVSLGLVAEQATTE